MSYQFLTPTVKKKKLFTTVFVQILHIVYQPNLQKSLKSENLILTDIKDKKKEAIFFNKFKKNLKILQIYVFSTFNQKKKKILFSFYFCSSVDLFSF